MKFRISYSGRMVKGNRVLGYTLHELDLQYSQAEDMVVLMKMWGMNKRAEMLEVAIAEASHMNRGVVSVPAIKGSDLERRHKDQGKWIRNHTETRLVLMRTWHGSLSRRLSRFAAEHLGDPGREQMEDPYQGEEP